MRFFALATTTSDVESLGPAVAIKPKPNKLRKLLRKKPRRSPSLQSALSEAFSELETVSSVENFRVVGHVEEIVFSAAAGGELSQHSSRESTAVDDDETPLEERQDGEKGGGMVVMKRELFSDKTIYVEALDHLPVVGDKSVGKNATMRSSYVDALDIDDGEENVEIKETMEISVVAEIKDGTAMGKTVHLS
jgi:hypothetical protein